ncbi:MAG: ABC transporter substrate-binding protein, partial [Candidatus Promineifilaceae bacterium]
MNKFSQYVNRDLPEGTVTFLFTDIEGSTKLLRQLGDEYATVLADQRRILRDIFESLHGSEVDTQGDSFFVSFPRATEAVAAAVEIQRSLAKHAWPRRLPVRVRMGLHTGEPLTGKEGYVGMDVHRAARIAHVGHGGQVLLSETTTPLVVGQLLDGVSLLDLGRHRLKDIERPERIHQLVIDGLISDFPQLKSLGRIEPAEPVERQKARLPAFLREDESLQRPLFVGREAELVRLNELLVKALEGQGQIAFLSGDAGSGKSSLMSAFTSRAGEKGQELLVAWGTCNAFSGSGDPYLPFRKVLGALTGSVEAEWAAGTVTTNEARALWRVMPSAVEAVLTVGAHLLDTLIPASPLADRLETAFPAGDPSLESLREYIRSNPNEIQFERTQLFEQFANVVRRISELQPVVIILDDLQWADKGSLDLLFHLSRSLAGARILLLAAYRPDEVAADRDHKLRPLLDEFRRLFGDAWLDLDRSPGRAFVDDFIDSESNRLGEDFRDRFHRRTDGHPLFVVELLRDMQERGDVVLDPSGDWVIGPSLDWDALPVRVEGAIESRIGRLEEELREILTVASVEGDTFTAQVVARVQEIQERKLLKLLSRELQKRHRLVYEDHAERLGRRLISHYRFVHQMFQHYLYNDLSSVERQLLHGEVGSILESLYDKKSPEIVVQLAHHFDAAGESEKAADYLLLAGDQARSLYAHQEAVEHYQRALHHLELLGDDSRLARTWMRLGLTYHNAFNYRQSRKAYDKGFSAWRRIQLAPGEDEVGSWLRLWHPGPVSLDASLAHDINSEYWRQQLFSGLLEIDDEGVVVPDIAQSWEIHDGGRTYIFHLRNDAKWSDGRLVSAANFIAAWKRILSPNADDRLAKRLNDIQGAQAYHRGEVEDEDLGLDAPDDFTLIIRLKQPASYFLAMLTDSSTFPVPGHVVEEHGDSWVDPKHIVTNGPYMISRWSEQGLVQLVRNPHYHGSFGGNVHRVEVMIRDPSTMWQETVEQFSLGNLDIVDTVFFPGPAVEHVRSRLDENHVNAAWPGTIGILL